MNLGALLGLFRCSDFCRGTRFSAVALAVLGGLPGVPKQMEKWMSVGLVASLALLHRDSILELYLGLFCLFGFI